MKFDLTEGNLFFVLDIPDIASGVGVLTVRRDGKLIDEHTITITPGSAWTRISFDSWRQATVGIVTSDWLMVWCATCYCAIVLCRELERLTADAAWEE